ncbi:acyltransferase family protein [Rhizobium sp. 'Codium 1']|uniref:acyltransferase family protein n=1 Tax=Rhizobium sp. 'Codium 1' TaxID=2940484 RepID=UPI001E2846BB|nr:acyltransferase [Rhizobium sp. 'Codium 1']MCC8934868.1 acyltransferase [Rhizobium sp. 'Codium 1']
MSGAEIAQTRLRESSLDLIRGGAALLVCANHLRAVSVENFQDVLNTSILQKLFYLMTSLGHQSVIVFFVLSGYFVGGSLLARGVAFSWREYGSARLIRLWAVLVPALVLTLAIDLHVTSVAPGVLSGEYATTWNMGPQPGGDYSLGVGAFVGNLLFLQEIFLPVFGSNDPLWSLAFEFWYYMLFPLLLIGFGGVLGSHRIGTRGLALLVAGLILIVLPDTARVGFLCWLGGAMVFVLKRSKRRIWVPVWLGYMIFAGGTVVSRWLGKAEYAPAQVDLVMGGATIFLLVAVANKAQPSLLDTLLSRGAYHLSEMSYSLYLIHFPLVLLIGGTFFGNGRLVPNPYGLAIYFCWLGLLLVVAWGFWYLFERHTLEIRRVVQQFLVRTQ